MRTRKHPKNRKELFEMILMMWFTAASENVKAFTFDRIEKRKQREKLKEKYQEYLQMWESLK